MTSLLLLLALTAADPDPKGVEFFEAKIRPVLIAQCYSCHSVEAEKNKKLRGGLLLDSRPGWQKGGDSGPVLVPGKPAESLLLKGLRHGDELKMPPKQKLSDAVIADFERWIALGAPDPRQDANVVAKRTIDIEAGKQHWAFRPLAAPPAPAGIDGLIRAKLLEKRLTPNPEAGRATLLRRVTFDLTGLPPTPEEVTAFLADTSPQAYEKVVDRLLAGERYGERWARHWLDIVRFAESGGYEFDKDRPGAYHYRDFVIRSLNADRPYDEFVRLQLAGDRLLPGNIDGAAATGFLVAGPFPGQTTAKTLQIIRYDQLDDMLVTASQAFLGLTLGCARCHDHKFDPVPQADYTHLLACLARTDSTETKIDPDPEGTRKAKAEYDAAHAPLAAAIARFEKETLPGKIDAWFGRHRDLATPTWLLLDSITATGKAPLKKLDEGVVQAAAKGESGETYTLTFHTETAGIQAVRIETLPHEAMPKNQPITLSEISATATTKDGKAAPVKFKDGKTPWKPGDTGKRQTRIYEIDGKIGTAVGTALTVTLKFDRAQAAGQVRVAISTTATPDADGPAALQHAPELAGLLRASGGKITPENQAGVLRRLRALDAEVEPIYRPAEEHAKTAPQPKLVTVFAATGNRGGEVHHLIRGEVERKNGVAKPGFLQVLMADGKVWQPASETDPRVGLANWLTDVDQGAGRLLARVLVNRLWQHHFGHGLVRTPNDFGTQGEKPTHPELLDHLAGELIRGGWRLKPLHRQIVLSATYRQSGATNPAGVKADPENRLWWRMPPRRLEAEAIRDALLAVSGTLNLAMYGPGTLDESSARRSVYLTVKRSRLTPFLQTFDAPEPVQSVGTRVTTTVPPQALALMNSGLVRQRAEKLAQMLKPKTEAELPAAIEQAYMQVLSRAATPVERDRLTAFVRQRLAGSAKTLDAALADACQVLLCLNEFVYVD